MTRHIATKHTSLFVLFMFANAAFAQSISRSIIEPTIQPTEAIKQETSTPKWKAEAEARFRFEARENTDFTNTKDDRSFFIGSRTRASISYQPSAEWKIFLQPQFSDVWGQLSSQILGNGTLSPGLLTSASTSDPYLSIHHAYVNWNIENSHAFLSIARQELNYGDHIILGNLGFSNVARSFDSGLIRWNPEQYTLDFIYAKIAESDVKASGLLGDTGLAGVYAALGNLISIPDFDLYVFWLRDNRSGTPVTFNFGTFGTRIKVASSIIDARLEAGDANDHAMVAYMFNAETGGNANKVRLAIEYIRASGDDPSTCKFTRYHQLFPTAHRWLGDMDFFGRQNIQSAVLHTQYKHSAALSLSADVHSFWRSNSHDLLCSVVTETPLSGQPSPITSQNKHAGEELDLVAQYRMNEHLTLEAMGGVLLSGTYLKLTGGAISYFNYLQSTSTF